MNDLKLTIPKESLHRSKSGVIYGQVYFQLGTEAFPDPRWSDLAVAFVLAWIAAIVRLCGSRNGAERVRFMDGPYWVDLSKSTLNGDTVVVQMVVDRLKGPVASHSVTTSLGGLFSESVELAQEVLATCRAKGWNNSEIDELADRMNTAAHLAKPRVL